MQRDKSLPGTGSALHDRSTAWMWDVGRDLWGAMLYYSVYDEDLDHDHCIFCGQRLCRKGSPYDDGIHEGFRALNMDWVCPKCYGLARDPMGLRLYDPAVWDGSDLRCFLRAAITWRMPPYRERDIELLFASLEEIGEGIPNVFCEPCRIRPVVCAGNGDEDWTYTYLHSLREEIPLLRLEDLPGVWDLMRPRVDDAGYAGKGLLIDFYGL